MTDDNEHPDDCLFCRTGEAMVHQYEPPSDDNYDAND